jgi:hypothetical protein
MECVNKNNFSVIGLLQEDILYDTYNLANELDGNIKKIIKDKAVQYIFMCKISEYDIFSNDIDELEKEFESSQS